MKIDIYFQRFEFGWRTWSLEEEVRDAVKYCTVAIPNREMSQRAG
jgi:hypothetical protein